ncbi:MAG TPA: fatty acyl-AMP ligase [Paraburkholderia sp.]|nr:fatty acyl-AMP ligase [Paraburkholderia sp.]
MTPNAPIQLRVAAWPYACESLYEVARRRAEVDTIEPAFTFIDYTGAQPEERAISHRKLDLRARQIAALLQNRAGAGDRVLLLFSAGIDYLCALFGCFYAGMVAVPAYPPLNPRLRERLAAVSEDCTAKVALTTRGILDQLHDTAPLPLPLSKLNWIATDTRLDALEMAWRAPRVDRETLAILQYTSGSTGTPKGVMVTHGNLLGNTEAIALHLQFTPDDHHLTWLPPYHDMGLMGAILGSFCAGVPVSFMAPAAFLRRPERWLTEISKRRCTVSGAPNFAYELCINKVRPEVLDTLDLSTWSLAYSGAEPVQADTLARFTARFGRCGFQHQAFYPCYGMAETTLFVTGKRREAPPRVLRVDSTRFVSGQCHPLEGAGDSGSPVREIVSCGIVATGHNVAVVDPSSGQQLADGNVGEIWVSGPSVANGYWQRPDATSEVFHARLPGNPNDYLRTGDLGFMLDSELYVSGRLKDVIIVRGVNHYPHDIESTVDRCDPAIRRGCGIAFSVPAGSEEGLVFVQEITRSDLVRADYFFERIRHAIYEQHGLQAASIALIESGSIPKTTSGKLARRPCRTSFIENSLALIARWENPLFTNV